MALEIRQQPVKTMIVEDEEIVSLGLRCALSQMPEVKLVAEVRDGKTAVEQAIEHRVDLVLMGLGVPGVDGIEATRLIKEALPAKVVILTELQNSDDVIACFIAGADAYCLRDVSAAQLIRVIRSVREGGIWVDAAVAFVARGLNVPDASAAGDSARRLHNKLSRREREVLKLLSVGLTNQEIADRLSVGPETVKTHVRHLMDKLNVTDRTQAAVKAVASGWLDS